jgi:hypothetical protein
MSILTIWFEGGNPHSRFQGDYRPHPISYGVLMRKAQQVSEEPIEIGMHPVRFIHGSAIR